MLLFSKIKTLITFAFCFLLQKVNLTNYISFKLLVVDDCIRLVNISNNISSQILLNFSKKNEVCDTSFQIKGPCDAGNWRSYAPDDFLVKDFEYEFMNEIAITFED